MDNTPNVRSGSDTAARSYEGVADIIALCFAATIGIGLGAGIGAFVGWLT